MTTTAEVEQDDARALGGGGEERSYAEGCWSLPESSTRPRSTNGAWRVVVCAREHMISRRVWYKECSWRPDDESADPGGQRPANDLNAAEVIWPTWPASLAEETAMSTSPLADLEQHWDATISRLRDSAKWMAAVVGAALASIVPTAPFTGLGQRHLTAASATLGLAGLIFVTITTLLILRVMRPQSVSYDDIREARSPAGLMGRLHDLIRYTPFRQALESPLYRWQTSIQEHSDLYLPCDVNSLTALRQLLIVEEITLKALACAREDARLGAVRKKLTDAVAARAARLYELRATAASIVAVGVYHTVRARSSVATYVGAASGLLGFVCLIAALTWPIK